MTHTRTPLFCLLLLVAFAMVTAAPATAEGDDDLGDQIRDAFKAHSKFIVTVSYSRMMQTGQMGEQDTGGTLTGVVIDPSGIVMISGQDFFGTTGMSGLAQLMGGGGGNEPGNFRVRLASGTEFAADFIGGDREANVAFVKAKLEEGMMMPAVPFDPIAAQSAEIGQQVILLGTYPDFMNHARKFNLARINAVIDREQGLYGLDGVVEQCAGALVLTLSGNAIGIVMERGNPKANPAAGGIGRLIRGVTEGGQGLRVSVAGTPTSFAAALGAARERAKQLAQGATGSEATPGADDNEKLPETMGLARMQALSTQNVEVLRNLGYKVDGVTGGIVVMGVTEDSAFGKAGLKAGDLIVGVNDTLLAKVNDEGDLPTFSAALAAAVAGKKLVLDVRRRTEALKLEVAVSD